MVGATVADNYLGRADNSGPGAGGYIRAGTASFTNCIFTGNESTRSDGGALYIYNGNVTIENCTFADNSGLTDSSEPEGGAIYMNNGTVTIRNSIFWDNQAGNDGNDGDTIYQNAGTLNISYSCMDGTGLPRMRFVGGTWGDGIITNNPLFATEYTDLHLKSTVERWDGASWMTDAVNSPCIDAGDPASTFSNEPTAANGARINMGAYGNTWQASKSLNAAPAVDTQAARVVATAAELRGVLTAGASSAITFYYGLSNPGATAAGWDATNVLSEAQSEGNVFSSVAGVLQESQTYWFRAYATNAFGDDWGDPVSFSTGPAAPGGGAGVIHVDADAVGVPDGLSWTNAFTAFEDALAAVDAGLGTSIWVAEGTYQSLATFTIGANGLSVHGGFAGTETSLTQRDWTNSESLLAGRTHRVVDIQADNVLLDGLTITNGYQFTGNGSGIRMENSGQNLTMLNCRIVGNVHRKDQGFGGGAYFYNAGTVLLSNTVFRANRATIRCLGVGFYSRGTTLTLRDCEIRDSYDSGGDQRPGKGFYLYDGTLTMIDTTVAGNYYDSDDGRRPGPGGGGYIRSGTASFTNCVFTGNDSDRSDGSGLYVYNGNVTIESCTFAGNGVLVNREESRGGAIYQNNGTVTIKNSILWGNEAGTSAEAGDTIYQNAGTLNISYSCMDGEGLPRVRFVGGTWGDGIITNNPLFATEYTDVHLKSRGGRWDGSSWVTDDVTSLCIDAGDPASDYSREANDNGGRINMGVYGNTAEASLSWKEYSGTILIIR